MKTFVIPGYSPKNKEWGDETAKQVDGEPVAWAHWEDVNTRFNITEETNKLSERIGEGKVNIIAKSIGTLVLMHYLEKNWAKVNKVVLCGVPINDLNENDKSYYKILSDLSPENTAIFQNSTDEHGGFEEVRRFLALFNPNVKIIEKPGSTHDYPYFDEFKEFLS